jgi:hypothetical protein
MIAASCLVFMEKSLNAKINACFFTSRIVSEMCYNTSLDFLIVFASVSPRNSTFRVAFLFLLGHISYLLVIVFFQL